MKVINRFFKFNILKKLIIFLCFAVLFLHFMTSNVVLLASGKGKGKVKDKVQCDDFVFKIDAPEFEIYEKENILDFKENSIILPKLFKKIALGYLDIKNLEFYNSKCNQKDKKIKITKFYDMFSIMMGCFAKFRSGVPILSKKAILFAKGDRSTVKTINSNGEYEFKHKEIFIDDNSIWIYEEGLGTYNQFVLIGEK